MEDEINLVDILKVIIKYRYLIIALVVCSLSFTLFIAKKQPKMYRATATILPVESSGGALSYSYFGRGSPGMSSILAVINSKVLAKSVVEELDLTRVIYKNKWDDKTGTWKNNFEPSMDSAAASVAGRVEMKNSKEGLLILTIVWNDPEMAAKIANTYVDKLSDFINNRSLNITFQKIDPAVPNRAPFSSRPDQNPLIVGSIALAAGIFLSFLIEYTRKIIPLLKAQL